MEFGAAADGVARIWLIGEIEANLKLCIEEKCQKIAKMRHKYAEWWLVLPDFIGYGLDELDRACFRDQVSFSRGCFEKVILLDPRDHTRSFEV